MSLYEYAFVCPISFDYFKEPVVANDGYTYEKSEIKMWLKKNNISPITGNKINSVLVPNNVIKTLVTHYIKNNNITDTGYDTKVNEIDSDKNKIHCENIDGESDTESYNESDNITE